MWCCLVNSLDDNKEAIKKALKRLPETKDLKREIETALRYASLMRDFLVVCILFRKLTSIFKCFHQEQRRWFLGVIIRIYSKLWVYSHLLSRSSFDGFSQFPK